MKIKLLHFSLSKTDNKAHIWARLDYDDSIFSGYIPNFWGIDEVNEQEIEVTKVKLVFLEHENGGRTNHEEYNSIADYLNSSSAKARYQQYKKNPWNYSGNPDIIDGVITLTTKDGNHTFTLKDTFYGITIPEDWYEELYADVVSELTQCELYQNKEDVIVKITEDLFGQRYFPVAFFPTDYIGNVDWYCKTKSLPLSGNGGVFYGFRVKSYDAQDIIDAIYANDGKIVKDREWDW